MLYSVALDGPAGAGKSTIARILAGKLGFVYVDTGALYRAIGKYALMNGKSPADPAQVIPLLPEISLELVHRDGEQRVILCGEDVTGELRTQEVSTASSQVSAIGEVRDFLFSLQREMAERYSVIMDGRDIGTVVLPQATVKIFLTASPEDRARRRFLELREKTPAITYEEVLQSVRERDYNDSHRAVAPLRPAEDAILVDTTGETLEQSIARMEALIREKLREKMEENV